MNASLADEARLPQIWRLHLKSAAEKGCDPGEFCIQTGVVGFGWPVEPDEDDLPWDAYYSRAKAKYLDTGESVGWTAAANGIKAMRHRDLCWTRTESGKYWLGRIVGEWRYRNGPEFRRADVLNVRACEWSCVGDVHEVPGKIINSLRASRTLQRVEGDDIRLFSMFSSNALHAGNSYDLPGTDCDLFNLLSPEDCEDLVGIFLQSEGYILFPGTCRADSKQFEFILRHRETGRYAAAQVKQGDAVICDQNYCQFDGDVFVFQTNGNYIGPVATNVRRLTAGEMRDFCESNRHVLPARVQGWMAITERLRHPVMTR